MRDRLFALEIEERGLSGKFEPDHPKVLAVKRQLEDAKRICEKFQDATIETVEGLNPIYETITEQLSLEKSNVEALQSELAAIEDTLNSLTQQVEELNRYEAELAALQRQVDAMELQYQTQYVKREQARLGEELQRTNISNLCLIQDPSLERRPVSPNKTLCAILGTLGTLLAASGFVASREAGHQIRLAVTAHAAESDVRRPSPVGDRGRPANIAPDRHQGEPVTGSLIRNSGVR